MKPVPSRPIEKKLVRLQKQHRRNRIGKWLWNFQNCYFLPFQISFCHLHPPHKKKKNRETSSTLTSQVATPLKYTRAFFGRTHRRESYPPVGRCKGLCVCAWNAHQHKVDGSWQVVTDWHAVRRKSCFWKQTIYLPGVFILKLLHHS